jgi:hypothetical protein
VALLYLFSLTFQVEFYFPSEEIVLLLSHRGLRADAPQKESNSTISERPLTPQYPPPLLPFPLPAGHQ